MRVQIFCYYCFQENATLLIIENGVIFDSLVAKCLCCLVSQFVKYIIRLFRNILDSLLTLTRYPWSNPLTALEAYGSPLGTCFYTVYGRNPRTDSESLSRNQSKYFLTFGTVNGCERNENTLTVFPALCTVKTYMARTVRFLNKRIVTLMNRFFLVIQNT